MLVAVEMKRWWFHSYFKCNYTSKYKFYPMLLPAFSFFPNDSSSPFPLLDEDSLILPLRIWQKIGAKREDYRRFWLHLSKQTILFVFGCMNFWNLKSELIKKCMVTFYGFELLMRLDQHHTHVIWFILRYEISCNLAWG